MVAPRHVDSIHGLSTGQSFEQKDAGACLHTPSRVAVFSLEEQGRQMVNHVRVLLLIANAAWLSPVFDQVDANALRARYGPRTAEVFDLRPGITLSVNYGDNRQICKLEIRPARNAPAVIPAAVIQQLVDELLPPLTRGAPKRQFMACAGAICWSLAEYDAVIIGQSGGDVTPNPEAPNPLAVIQFRSCEASKQ